MKLDFAKKVYYQHQRMIIFVVVLILSLEILYLLFANLAINSEWGKKLVNRRPRKMLVSWDRGYSLIPGAVHLRDFQMRFQKKRNWWTVNADRVDGDITLWRLFKREFFVGDLQASGLDFQYRRLDEPVAGVGHGKHRWWITLPDISVQSITRVDINGFELVGSGQGSGALRYQTRGQLTVHAATLQLDQVRLEHNSDVLATDMELDVTYANDPFVPSVEKGRQALQHMEASIRLSATTEMFPLPVTLFKDLPWLTVRHSGRFAGDLVFDRGTFQPGSRLGITDMDIQARYRDLAVGGKGAVDVVLSEPVADLEDIRRANLEVRFEDYRLTRDSVDTPLVTGTGFRVLLETDSVDIREGIPAFDVTVDMPNANVPDVCTLNSYLEDWPLFGFEGGRASISGQFIFDQQRGTGSGSLRLFSKNMQTRLRDRQSSGTFSFTARLHELVPDEARVSFDGDFSVENMDKSWHFRSALKDGELHWPEPGNETDNKLTLAHASGGWQFAADVSDIGFVNRLFSGKHGLSLHGPGGVSGEAVLDNGQFSDGTRFAFDVPEVEASLLGYRAAGQAQLSGSIQSDPLSLETGKKAEVQLTITDYRVFLPESEVSHSSGKKMTAFIGIPDFKLTRERPQVEMRIEMTENTIPDISTYNHLWAEDAPFQIVSGKASSRGVLTFSDTTGTMHGSFRLTAPGARTLFEGVSVSGDLSLDIKLSSPDPVSMMFDVSGSRLALEHAYVGPTPDDRDWELVCELNDFQLHWDKPLQFGGEVDMTMTDTEPIIHYFTQQHHFVKYVSGILNIQNIFGSTRIQLDEEYLHVRNLEITGDVLHMMGKLRMNRAYKRGALYVQFRRIPFLVTIEGDERSPHMFGARKKFEAFDVAQQEKP